MNLSSEIIRGPVALLPIDDISTDVILPAVHMITTSRNGLGKGLFQNWRFSEEGETKSEFILNQPLFNKSRILIAGSNFGCGSSREHAVWALIDFGIQVILAPNFAPTFAINAAKNGLAVIQLDQGHIESITNEHLKNRTHELCVSLLDGKLSFAGDTTWFFELSDEQKTGLIEKLDDIFLAQKLQNKTAALWMRLKKQMTWLEPVNIRECSDE